MDECGCEKACAKLSLRRHEDNGYVPKKAYVNYVAYWTKVNGKNPGVEKKIVLPKVVLKKLG